MGRTLSTAISNVPHLAAFDDLAKHRLEGVDLSVLMMYIIDTAPESALVYLAEQFNVLGWKGWNLTQTESDRRDLIKRAIELNRYKGTVWAIKESCRSVGFDDASVIEGVGIDYDGTYVHDAAITYAGGSWYNFRVIITTPDNVEINGSNHDLVRELILAYKNARSILIDISYQLVFSDGLGLTDEFLEFTDEGIVEAISTGIVYDGLPLYNSVYLHDKAIDDISLTIYQNGVIIEQDEF